ncbi:MAG TPA: hypothetical protein VMX76_01305 [Nevskiaceae bacterium]|nr:hypothetical protein [Nevskiaceae bacterium]
MAHNEKTQAVNLSQSFESGADMSAKEKEILAEIVSRTGFLPQEVIWRSSYWGTKQIGAVLYRGIHQEQPAVLKIQGVKPAVSEIFMLQQFTAQNRSQIIRSPQLYEAIPWSDKNHYEALILEYARGEKVLQSGRLQTPEKISQFFTYYQEYQENCLPQKPWLSKPRKLDWQKRIQELIAASRKAYPNHPFRLVSDEKLATEAAKLLNAICQNVPLEFVHSHFSAEDLIYQDKKKKQVILTSNLFWKWRPPFYDAVFGYHWFMYTLGNVEGITPNQVEKQREVWLLALFNLTRVEKSPTNTRLLKTALLERAVAGFLLDSFLVDPNQPIARYLTESTRNQAKKLFEELS